MNDVRLTSARVMLWMLLSVVMLSLAAAPFGQWYLAWFALAPFFIGVGKAATMRGALLRAWLAGVAYFAINLWWLWTASIPGTIVLVLYLALYWAIVAGLLRGLSLLGPLTRDEAIARESTRPRGLRSRGVWRQPFRVLGIATVWVAIEWVRCNVAIEFPWMPLGSTQSPLVVMCQVADLGGPWIVSFWVALPSAFVALWWLNRSEQTNWWSASLAVAAIVAVVAAYGAWRLETARTTAGPRAMVIQSNFPHLPGGAPTVDRRAVVEYFLVVMPEVLRKHPADLVMLPEAEFPPLNDEARVELAQTDIGLFVERTYQRLLSIAKENHTALLVGGNAVTGWSTRGSEHVGSEIRNSAFFFDPQAQPVVTRYDKIFLVRFSERPALTIGPEWLRQLALAVSASRVSQPMHAGSLSDFRPFRLSWPAGSVPADGATDDSGGATPSRRPDARFISPICLENIDPAIVAQMIRGSSPTGKQADFIANISNDGWFATQERYQHLQSTVFRCIENRVPMVRCSNTGISVFIDSSGRVQEAIAPNGAGFAVRRLELDNRRTFYMRFGDVFAYACMGLVAAAIVGRAISRFGRTR